MPEPDEELGPKIADAFQTKAHTVEGLRATGMAREARRRIRKRRQALVASAAAVVVVVAIGGVWGAVGGPGPVATSADNASSAGGSAEGKSAPQVPDTTSLCPPQHSVLTASGLEAVPAGTGLDLEMPVYGLQACRYRILPDDTMLLGALAFNATTAQQIVDAIKVLPERNPDLPVFKCPPQLAKPSEAIVLRFDTANGIREIWVSYDGCSSAGFFTGSRSYGLYAEPLKLFMKGTVRPSGGTYLDHLKGW
jgi:hypothetical protein